MDVSQRLEQLRREYGSVDAMVDYLNTLGRDDVHRTTLYRWLNGKSSPRHRAEEIVRILASRGSERGSRNLKLRVAQPITDMAFPSFVVCAASERARNGDRSFEMYALKDVEVHNDIRETGEKTLELLREDMVDVAIAATSIVRNLISRQAREPNSDAKPIARLCTLAQAPLIAIAPPKSEIAKKNKKKMAIWQDLEECTVSFLAGSAVPLLLNDLESSYGFKVPKRLGVTSSKQAASELRKPEKSIVYISWDASIREVMRDVVEADGEEPVPVLQGMLGSISQDIVVHQEPATAAAIRQYLDKIIFTVNGLRKTSTRESLKNAFLKDVRPEFFRLNSYLIRDLELDTILKLWDSDVKTYLAADVTARTAVLEKGSARK